MFNFVVYHIFDQQGCVSFNHSDKWQRGALSPVFSFEPSVYLPATSNGASHAAPLIMVVIGKMPINTDCLLPHLPGYLARSAWR
jgi:hypothetical protein